MPNSLSIEGYVVTPELIENIRNGLFLPDIIEKDNKTKMHWQPEKHRVANSRFFI